jgi:hypothetical protein
MQISSLSTSRAHRAVRGSALINKGPCKAPLPLAPRRNSLTARGRSRVNAVTQPQKSNAERFVEELQLEAVAQEPEDSVVVGSIDELRSRLVGLQTEVRAKRAYAQLVARTGAGAVHVDPGCLGLNPGMVLRTGVLMQPRRLPSLGDAGKVGVCPGVAISMTSGADACGHFRPAGCVPLPAPACTYHAHCSARLARQPAVTGPIRTAAPPALCGAQADVPLRLTPIPVCKRQPPYTMQLPTL